MCVYYSEGSKGTTLYSRYMMKVHLGEIPADLTVDHINEDYTDDRLENFQLLTKAANASKSNRLRRKITWYDFICPECKRPARKQLREVKHNWKQGKGGPYCSRSCSGRASTRNQYGCKDTVCGTNAMYARGCRCDQCRKAHNLTINEWKKKQRAGTQT